GEGADALHPRPTAEHAHDAADDGRLHRGRSAQGAHPLPRARPEGRRPRPQRLRGDDGRRLPHHGAGAQLRRQPAADRSDGRGDPLRRRRRGEALRDREPRRGDPGLPGHPGPGSAGGGPMSSTRGAAKRPPSYFSAVTNGRRALAIAALAGLFPLGVLGFRSVYGGSQYLLAGVMALLFGTLIALIGARWRWGPLRITPLVLLVYLLFGPMFAAPTRAIWGII